jgi:SAM-dependent methyltransferase
VCDGTRKAAPSVTNQSACIDESQAGHVKCRFCDTALVHTFVDLGMSPLCETYPSTSDLRLGEMYYPLHVYICENCWLVQLEAFETPENIFSDYAYFASYSDSWLKHCEKYCAAMKDRLKLGEKSLVIEAASNDGYLLQYFVREGIPVLGVEPAANVAKAAVKKGVPTLVRFMGVELARELSAKGQTADLVLGNNVLAQVPDLNDFVEGLKILLKPEGVLTLEFPHLLRLIEHNEFDTIYHEHFSYFSLITVIRILAEHGLRVFDVEELKSHGGSLRVFASRSSNERYLVSSTVEKVLRDETEARLNRIEGYQDFSNRVRKTKLDFVEFLMSASREGKKVAGYGAPGKSATLLHYCGIGKDLIEFTVDRSEFKQGRHLPGSRIPIFPPDRIRQTRPDFVVILPWNLRSEIEQQLSYIREWGGKFVIPIPSLAIH